MTNVVGFLTTGLPLRGIEPIVEHLNVQIGCVLFQVKGYRMLKNIEKPVNLSKVN